MRGRIASFIAFRVNSAKRLATVLPAALALSVGVGVAHAQCSGTTTVTCTSSGAVTINGPASFGNYHAATATSITVPGTVTGTVNTVSITLNTFTALSSGSAFGTQGLSLMLVSPDNRQFEFFRGVGDGSQSLSFTALTLSDSAANAAPIPTVAYGSTSGSPSFKPSAYDGDATAPTNYVSPGPGFPAHTAATLGAAPNNTFTAVFAGAVAQGTWTIYGEDHDDPTDHITFASWTLTMGVSASSVSTSTIVGSNLPTSFTSGASSSVILTATVSSTGQPTGTVGFADNGVAIGGCTAQPLSGATANSSTATCTHTFGAEGNRPVVATYNPTGSFATSTSNPITQVVRNHSTNPTGTQYCNTGSISAPGTQTNQLIYPSFLNVPALANTVANVSVQLNGLVAAHGIGSAQFLLVDPSGTRNLDFLSHVGSSPSQPSVNGTIADNNPTAPVNSAFVSGFLYEPTDQHNQADTFSQPPSPAPQVPGIINLAQPSPGSQTLGQVFSTAVGQGDWLLYVYDNAGPSSAISLTGGWCLTFTLNTGTPTTLTLPPNSPARSGQPVAFTATVVNSNTAAPITTGTVTFTENGSAPAGTVGGNNVVNLNALGQATFTTSALPEGDHTILATYTGSFNSSNAFVIQRIDNNSTISGISGNLVSFCNTGNILLPAGSGGAFNSGRANPNPSNIFAAQLPGITSTVGLTLKSFFTSSNVISTVESLLVGPGGGNANTLDFFSETGLSNTVLASGDYVFKDSGSAVPQGAFGPGTYKPTAYGGADSFFSSPAYVLPAGPYQYAAPIGAKTFVNTYGGVDGSGTWSLYFDQNTHGDNAGATNGWCMNFTQTPPTISATKGPNGLHVIQGDVGDAITIDVHNAGPGGAGGAIPLKVTDTFPAGLTPTGGTGTNWSCGVVAQVITCTSTDFIASGSNFPTLTINFTVAANATAPGTVTNQASISGSALTSSVNTNILSIAVDPAPDVTVTAGHTGTFTQGSTGTLTITGHNIIASSKTHGTTTVVDTMPTGWTLNSFNSTGNVWTCGAPANVVTCTSSEQVNGGSDYTLLNLVANVPANSAVSVSHSVTISGGGELATYTGNDTSSDNLTVIQVPASIVANAGTTPQSATVNTAFTNALAVTVKDAGGVVIPGANVTFLAPASGASGKFSNNTQTITVATNASGISSAPFTANATAGGPYNVSATVGVLAAINFSLTNNPGPATQMTANAGTTPQSATISTAFANPLAVTVQDALNNPVAGVSVTFTAPASGASGKFSNNTATIAVATNASGIASAPFTANTVAGGPYTVTAAAAALTTVNFSLTNTAGPASSMAANAGTTPQSATISTAFANPLAVTVKDASNNPVSGVNVTFTAPGSGASGTFSNVTATITVATNASGIASAPFTANSTAGGPYTVTAMASGLTTVNFSLTNTAGGASSMTANAGTTPQTATVSTAFANPLAVTVKDGGNNPVSGVNVTFTAPGSGASGTFSNATATITVVTNASGVASAPFTANATAGGPYTVTAMASGLTTVNFSLTNSAVPVNTMTANPGTTPQSANVSTAFANPLAVTVLDPNALPVAGVNVTFTAPGSGASGTFSNATNTIVVATNAAGVASAPFTANATAGGPYTVTAMAAGLPTVNFSLTNTLLGGPAPDVTAQFTVNLGGILFNRTTGKYSLPVSLTNNGASLSAVAFVVDNLSAGNSVVTPSGTTSATTPAGSAYVELGPIAGGATTIILIQFTHTGSITITETPRLLGPGLR